MKTPHSVAPLLFILAAVGSPTSAQSPAENEPQGVLRATRGEATSDVTATAALGALISRTTLRVVSATGAESDAIAAANAALSSVNLEDVERCFQTDDPGPWGFDLRLRRTGAVRRARFVPNEAQEASASASAECIRLAVQAIRFENLGTRIQVSVARATNFGFGGLGLRGTGRGGGGTGEGTIGLGNLGTIGHGRSSMRARVRQGNATVMGSLSREVIRRVIRRHLSEARYCYEGALATNASLEGTVVMRFEISPTGAVSSAEGTTVPTGFGDVASCLKRAILRWTFPAPAGGGIVRVNYPFAFRPG